MTNLHTLCIVSNDNITDEGIKHMTYLRELNTSYNNITNNGIKNMNLQILYASLTRKITDEGRSSYVSKTPMAFFR